MQKNIPLNINSTPEINLYLSNRDPIMSKIISVCGSVSVPLEINYFEKLCKIIIGQQLSNKVANTIIERFVSLLNYQVTPENILNRKDLEFREIGISFSKISYIKNLSTAITSKTLFLEKLEHLGDLEVIEILTKVKGIGRWSAEMFLIFSLGRLNVFSASDGGLKTMLINLYGIPTSSHQPLLDKITCLWSPYKSIASLYLWDLINRNLLEEVKKLVN